VVVMVLDAQAGIADQDAHLLGLVLEAGRALVLAVNKWDGLSPEQRETVRQDLERKLGFLRFARDLAGTVLQVAQTVFGAGQLALQRFSFGLGGFVHGCHPIRSQLD
jgi:predicted GTPase